MCTTCSLSYALSPLYTEEDSVCDSSMNWERFSENIFVAEFSAHEGDVPERPEPHGSAGARRAGTRDRLPGHFPWRLPPRASPRQSRGCRSNQLPGRLGRAGLGQILPPFLVPLGDPRVQTRDRPRDPDLPHLALSPLLGFCSLPWIWRHVSVVTTASAPFLLTKVSRAPDGVSRLHHEMRLQGTLTGEPWG